MKIINLTKYFIVIFIFSFSHIQNCKCNNAGDDPAYFTLEVNAENGSVTIDPVMQYYREGTRVALTGYADESYDFHSWSGGEESKENPFTFVMDRNKTITGTFIQYNTIDYYVDFDGGDDGNDGLSPNNAWKHAPGDGNAQGNPAEIQLQPGNRILFKGGVRYRGSIEIPEDGSHTNHISCLGNAWPGLEDENAIIDGSELIAGWIQCASPADCNENPNYLNIYYAYIPNEIDPLSANLHEYNSSSAEDEFLWPAQDPDPVDFYFYDRRDSFRTLPLVNLTRTSITDAGYFIQADSTYWGDSYLLIWVNPNVTVTRKILSFDPSEHSVTFEELGENAIYPDGRDQYYAVFNSPHAIDNPGEYFISTTPDSQNRLKILLWPRNTSDLGNRISYSVRTSGIDINTRSNVTIEGFDVIKHSGTGLRDGVGIGTIAASYQDNYNIVIKNNTISHNRKGGSGTGYGGIFLDNCTNVIVENNEISMNPRNSGIFISGGGKVKVNNNSIIRSGSTSLRLYTVKRGILQNNLIFESKGTHANGITLYMGCRDILIANNRVVDSGSPVTFQDSGNLWFINNLIDSFEGESNVNEWGDTGRGPWERGIIAFLNNTIIRNSRNASLNIGGASASNTYISINNIIDGGGGYSSVYRCNNIYTGLAWNQAESYGWSLAGGESVEEDLSVLFADPGSFDYSLRPGSPATGAGISILPYVPSDIFPDFNFILDIDGNQRSGWDIGAYAY